MRTNNKYDLIVIGAGSGGLNVAAFMNRAGFKVLLIDKSDKNIGGDCLNTGCVPSKALLHVASIIHATKHAKQFGIKIEGKLAEKKVAQYIIKKQDTIREHENAAHFRKLGMDVVLGMAKFAGKNSVKVNNQIYYAKRILLATGSRPRRLAIPGIEQAHVVTNEEIFTDDFHIPKRLVVIGGGPIGCELGQALARLGSKVTIITRDARILPRDNETSALILQDQLKKEGISFLFNYEPKEVLTKDILLVSHRTSGKTQKIPFDTMLTSIGRELNIENLELENAGIQTNGKGRIILDPYLRTTNKNVLVAGDLTGMMFTHAAETHARVLITNFFSPFKKKINYDDFAWVTYTSPQIATFGLNETEIKERGLRYERIETDHAEDDRSIVDDVAYGKSVLYISKNKLLGGSMVAENAGEIIQELILARHAKLDVSTLLAKTYPYPTQTRVNKKAIGEYLSRKLTPFAKKIMRWLW